MLTKHLLSARKGIEWTECKLYHLSPGEPDTVEFHLNQLNPSPSSTQVHVTYVSVGNAQESSIYSYFYYWYSYIVIFITGCMNVIACDSRTAVYVIWK